MSWYARRLLSPAQQVQKDKIERAEVRLDALELAELNRKETENASIFKWGSYFIRYVHHRPARTGYLEYFDAVPEHYTVRPSVKMDPDMTIPIHDLAMYGALIKFHAKRGR